MKFRPCIDIHNGMVKQLVGGSLADQNNYAAENFVSDYDAVFYAKLYSKYSLSGGHIIILNSSDSEFYEPDRKQAFAALEACPDMLEVGGGINDENAAEYLEKGASHVIVTSFVFSNGQVDMKRLEKLVAAVGKERLVIDLSCRKKGGDYYIVTDRWQKFTDVMLTVQTLSEFSGYCSEFLVHAVDAEGKARGIEEKPAEILAQADIPSTYAGGIGSFDDLDKLKTLGKGRLDFTVGSALDIFGGKMKFEDTAAYRA